MDSDNGTKDQGHQESSGGIVSAIINAIKKLLTK
ncbi:MAG: hypothetical protein ACI9O4_002170 [Chitinophagales bacterium]|jgi:hypothetical protein